MRISGADTRFEATDCVKAVRDAAAGALRFDRVLETPAGGFRWDSPGARVRFRTDSRRVTVHLRYTDLHQALARNSVGFYRIDGLGAAGWRFTRPEPARSAANVALDLPLETPVADGLHDYELIWPYGDSVDFCGASVERGARWGFPTPRPAWRYVAFGDSVTHGFTASDVSKGYPLQVAERMGWQLINAGYAGRGTRATDGDLLAGLLPDVVSILIGVNDWQGGVDPARHRSELTGLIARIRGARPTARVRLITPLWVAPDWKPEAASYPLEDYRRVVREVASAFAGGDLRLVEGPSLIDPDPALFDPVAVHPNDAGFEKMAARLGGAIG